MITSRYKLLPLIGRLFITLIGIGAGIFTALFLLAAIEDFQTIGIIVTLMFSMLSMTFLFIGTESLKRIKVNESTQSISIIYFGLIKQEYKKDELRGFSNSITTNNSGSYSCTIVESIRGNQIIFSAQDYTNYNELNTAILNFCEFEESIQVNYFTRFATILYIYMGFVIIFIIGSKLLELI